MKERLVNCLQHLRRKNLTELSSVIVAIFLPVIYEESEDTFKVGLRKLTNNKSTAEQMEDFHKLLERTSTYGTKGWTKKNKDNFKGHLQQYNEADFFKKNPYLHSVEIPAMISASYRGGASDHAEGFFRQKKNTMERQGC